MEYCRLQAGCLVIVMYIAFIYYRECKRYHKKLNSSIFDELFILSIICIIFDGITAVTVNNLETVGLVWNKILHMFFLVAIDAVVYMMFGYMLQTTGVLSDKKGMRTLLHIPYLVNVLVVLININKLEFKQGTYTNYSMGGSAYTCFAMVGIYVLFSLIVFFKRWNYIESNKRICILTKDYIQNLCQAAPMHDIGKIAVPDVVLQKPGRLTEEEFMIIKQHAVNGGRIIKETFGNLGEEEYTGMAYEVAKYHHEKWNGKGYPEGLIRHEIPLCARIMAVADVFDAVSEKRCYREAMKLEQCFAIISEGSGQDFDPIVAETFLDIKDKVAQIHEEFNVKL